jgi:hypothetical protein
MGQSARSRSVPRSTFSALPDGRGCISRACASKVGASAVLPASLQERSTSPIPGGTTSRIGKLGSPCCAPPSRAPICISFPIRVSRCAATATHGGSPLPEEPSAWRITFVSSAPTHANHPQSTHSNFREHFRLLRKDFAGGREPSWHSLSLLAQRSTHQGRFPHATLRRSTSASL